MKRIIAIVIMVFSALAWYVSTDPGWAEAYTEFRTGKPLIDPGHRGFGDLYNLTFIPDYNMPHEYHLRDAEKDAEDSTDLYLFCDSYLVSHVEKQHFYGVDSLVKIKWWDNNSYRKISSLRKSRRNILVIELSERFVREVCSDYKNLISPLEFVSGNTESLREEEKNENSSGTNRFIEEHVFNPNINSNIEFNLFNYRFLNRIKEIKGDINYRVFHRVNPDVTVDEKNHFLFYTPTLRGDHNMNSFYPVDSSELSKIKENLRRAALHYRKYGFERVYFSVIPNPVSVVDPGRGDYNGLLTAIAGDSIDGVNVLDLYPLLRQDPARYYSRSDTHWNSQGLQLWLDEINKLLRRKLNTD